MENEKKKRECLFRTLMTSQEKQGCLLLYSLLCFVLWSLKWKITSVTKQEVSAKALPITTQIVLVKIYFPLLEYQLCEKVCVLAQKCCEHSKYSTDKINGEMQISCALASLVLQGNAEDWQQLCCIYKILHLVFGFKLYSKLCFEIKDVYMAFSGELFKMLL